MSYLFYAHTPYCDVDKPEFQDVVVALGKRLAAKRRELKISQTQLGFEVGLDLRHIRRIEKGEANIGLVNLLKILQVLDLKIGDVLDSSKSS